MNNNAPYICYLGLDQDGNLAMFLTEYALSIVGSRLLKAGQKFPVGTYDVFDPDVELSRKAITEAIRSTEAFLNNEQDSHATPVFGEATDKPRRKKRI